MPQSATGFDWTRFEDALVDGVVDAVRVAVASDPGEDFYAAALSHVYCEADGVISLPMLSMDTVSALADPEDDGDDGLAREPADWEYAAVDWLPGDQERRWQQALTAHACRGSTADWNAAYRDYMAMLTRVCLRSRAVLRVQFDDFIVVLVDENRHEELIRATLTAEEVQQHFPHFDRRAAEAARVRGLPPAQQAEYHVSRLDSYGTMEEAQSCLRALGPAAVPALLPLLARPGMAGRAAAILADIGQADDAVTGALASALMGHEGPDQAWAARALSRLGQAGLVLAKAGELSVDVVVAAVIAPYTSFRDRAASPLPLDYRQLAGVLEHQPQYAAAIAAELGPGRGECTIGPGEVGEALRGLASPHAIIRSHAARVLGNRNLGPAAAPQILPRLAAAARDDPDPDVRRLAILSLRWWSNDARPYAHVIRDASDNDPHPGVRDTASHCLRETTARQADTL